MIRVSKIRKAINKKREKEKQPEISLKDFIEHVNKKYKLELKKSPLSGIPDDLKESIIVDFVQNVDEAMYDCNEHIYLRFPRAGNYIISVNLRDNTEGNIGIVTSPAGTTDLQAFKYKMKKDIEMQEYADYCVRAFKAKILSYEEFLKSSKEAKDMNRAKPPLSTNKNKFTGNELLKESGQEIGADNVPKDWGRYDK